MQRGFHKTTDTPRRKDRIANPSLRSARHVTPMFLRVKSLCTQVVYNRRVTRLGGRKYKRLTPNVVLGLTPRFAGLYTPRMFWAYCLEDEGRDSGATVPSPPVIGSFGLCSALTSYSSESSR